MEPEDVFERLNQGEQPLFIDARRVDAFEASERKLPGAIRVDPQDADRAVEAIPRGGLIVVYCTCPREASAVRTSERLHSLGFNDVHVLAGGFDAWESRRFPTEMKSAASAAPSQQ